MMEHLNMQSMDKVAANVEKIRELFPNCVTERINNEGKLEHAIDFDMLKQELSDHVVDGLQERYQFTWPDKRKAILAANAPINKTLRPCREESVDFDNTENLYIEGDNLEVLKLLQETYLGKVKMIYIDPPYNTGNDFVYEDDFKQSADEYIDNSGQLDEEGNRLVANTESNGRFHTDWLNMIYPRLKLAKDLLSEDGVIFISIDDNEVENLKKIGDEIFGVNNYCGMIPYRKRTTKTDVPFGISQDFEWIIIFAKSNNFFAGVPVDRKYYSTEDYPKDRWRLSDLTTQKIASQRPNSAFDLVDPKTKKVYKYNPRRLWAITKDTFDDYYKKGKIVFPDDYDFLKISVPAYRVFESEDRAKALKMYGSPIALKSFSTALPNTVGMNEQGSKEIDELVGNKIFTFPKPTSLIKQLVLLLHCSDSLILDFFSGSATTAHAVMQLNAEDGGKRKFIMVQLQEECSENSEAYKAGYKNICEIGKERIRRAGKKIKEENPLTTQDLDIGFRVLKCDSSNMEDVYFTPKEYMDKQQSLFVDNIKKDRNDEDLLFDAMLKLDTPLSSKIEKITIAGKTVYNVAQGHLMACFDKDVTDAVITAIAKEMPSYFVMRDSSLANDSVAINFEQIFNTYSPQTVRRVL